MTTKPKLTRRQREFLAWLAKNEPALTSDLRRAGFSSDTLFAVKAAGLVEYRLNSRAAGWFLTGAAFEDLG